jgi:hypothetical protein
MLNETILAQLKLAAERADEHAKQRRSVARHELAPGVALLEAGTAACVFGAVQRRGDGEGAAGLVVGAALQAFALFAADSPFALHADAVATGLLVASAYRYGLGSGTDASTSRSMWVAARRQPGVTRRIEFAAARLIASEGP